MAKELEQELANLKQQLQLLSEQVDWMKLVVKMAGVDGPWVSPQIVGAAIGRSSERIRQDIQTAEEWRARGKKWHLVYGVHYRNDQAVNASQATWKVHLPKYYEFVVAVPPDQLRVS